MLELCIDTIVNRRMEAIRMAMEVRPSRSRPDRGTATFRYNTLNQRDEVVQTFTGTLLVWRRDGGIHLRG
jgi:acyl dehydratase